MRCHPRKHEWTPQNSNIDAFKAEPTLKSAHTDLIRTLADKFARMCAIKCTPVHLAFHR